MTAATDVGGQKHAPLAEPSDSDPCGDRAGAPRPHLRGPSVRRHVQHDERMLRFVNARCPEARGARYPCPDHFLRTKIKPLFVDWNPDAAIATG